MSEKISQATGHGEAAPDGEVALEVRLEQETVWLTQRQMADVFHTTPRNVGTHLNEVFADGELERAATTR